MPACSFLLIQTLAVSSAGSSHCVPATQVRGPGPATEGSWDVTQKMGVPPAYPTLSLFLSHKIFLSECKLKEHKTEIETSLERSSGFGFIDRSKEGIEDPIT